MQMTASDRLIQHMSLGEGQAVAIHNPSNMFYLTGGYTGEGVVYISAQEKVIITDSRYTEQAERQAPSFTVKMVSTGISHSRLLADQCKKESIHTLYCEENYLTVRTWNDMRAELGDGVSCVSLAGVPEKLREIKTPEEVDCIRRACDVTSRAFTAVLPKIKEGITERELQIELDFLQYQLGGEGNSFTTIMAFGENGSLPHAMPGSRRLKKGDIITMDFGCKVGNYCSDMTRDVAFGEPSAEMRRVYDTVQKVQAAAREKVGPGKVCCDIHNFAVSMIDEAGYPGRMGHGLGHSVGIDIHENPRFSPLCNDVTVPGMVITVEPGIYLPGVGGVRIEDTVLVTETGYESLTTAPRDLIIL